MVDAAAAILGVPTLTGFGRLKAGVSPEQATAEMTVLDRQYEAAHPGPASSDRSAIMRVVPLKERLVADLGPMLWTMFGAVGFVLLIACANVASIMLARATSRSREFAVRAALGAGRGRLIRQVSAVSLVLAAAGGGLGVLVAASGLGAIAGADALFRTGGVNGLYVPGLKEIHLDKMVLGFTLLLSIATGILFGLLPSLQISRPELSDGLRDRGAAMAAHRRGAFGINIRSLFVVAQVALSIILLIGAGLLMQSFYRLHSVNPGFPSSNLLTAKIALPRGGYDTDQKRDAFFRDLRPRLEQSPGMRSVAIAMSLPTTSWIRTNITEVEGRPELDAADAASYAVVQSISPGYFHTLGIPIKQGRDFSPHDNTWSAAPVMILNETLAKRLWPEYPAGVNPVGLHLKEGYDKALGGMEVVGIAADIREGGLASDAVPEFYLPIAKHPLQIAFVVARTEGDPVRFTNVIREQVFATDHGQPVSDVRTMENLFEATLGQRRITMALLGSFAFVALVLAMFGLYGVMTYSVAQRTQEIGVRRALGAQQTDILRLILYEGLEWVLIGIAIGTGGACLLARGLTPFLGASLFHTSATDPVTLGGIAFLFVVVAVAARYIPARRAAHIDPMTALRMG